MDAAACAATVERLRAHREPRALVVGNPNTGKSTLINAVAGTRLKVGNWSGVTVEKREARLKRGEQTVHLLDLPGTCSLSPHTPEELITRTALLDEAPDVLLNVVDAGNLERNLYLTLQLLEFQVPLTIALNLVDEAKNKGLAVERAGWSAIGVPVVETVGSKPSARRGWTPPSAERRSATRCATPRRLRAPPPIWSAHGQRPDPAAARPPLPGVELTGR